MPDGFRFNLQRILDIRTHKEAMLKNELGLAKKKLYAEQLKKEQLCEEYKRQQKILFTKKLKEHPTAEELNCFNAYFNRLNFEIRKQEFIIEKRQQEVNEINQKLVIATQEKRVLERLKERQYAQFVYNLRKAEQNFLDEVGIQGYVRRSL